MIDTEGSKMKKQLCMILSTILFIVCLVTVPNNVQAEWQSALYSVPSFKFTNHADGIGCGNCPVYTAPYEDAYRIGNAVLSTGGCLYAMRQTTADTV